jgi:hypothetical protein
MRFSLASPVATIGLIAACAVSCGEGWCFNQNDRKRVDLPVKNHLMTRRTSFIAVNGLLVVSGFLLNPTPSFAVADCFKDCMKNCKLIAPKDPDYCTSNCEGYCEQSDRTDGLSGSVSATSGEVGILGGAWGQGTVPKGEDKVSTYRCLLDKRSILSFSHLRLGLFLIYKSRTAT